MNETPMTEERLNEIRRDYACNMGQVWDWCAMRDLLSAYDALVAERDKAIENFGELSDWSKGLDAQIFCLTQDLTTAERERDSARVALRSCFDFIRAEFYSDEAIAQDGHPVERGRARYVFDLIAATLTQPPQSSDGAFGEAPRSHRLAALKLEQTT